MRTFTLLFSALVLSTAALHAQTVATFDTLSLSGNDTQYVNYLAPGTDVGFNNGLAHFPCIYDTAGGDYWASGFIYSNWTDSTTNPGFGADSVFYQDPNKECAAKTGIGYGGTAQYAVAYCNNPITYQTAPINVNLTGVAVGQPVGGVYVTNTSFAYSSMHDGDAFAKKFGGNNGNDPDWFKLTIKGYSSGALTANSVEFYLADYRFADNDSDYIVKTWQWVSLLPLGHVDSLSFALSSSDTSQYGMNTPAYFCIDNFTTNETDEAVGNVSTFIAKVYPNPATDKLFIDIADNSVQQVNVYDMAGRMMGSYPVTGTQLVINTAPLSAGIYVLQLTGNNKTAIIRFVKQ